jgi:hypothetical protein
MQCINTTRDFYFSPPQKVKYAMTALVRVQDKETRIRDYPSIHLASQIPMATLYKARKIILSIARQYYCY